MNIICKTEKASAFVSEQEIVASIEEHYELLKAIQEGRPEDRGYLGWLSVTNEPLEYIKTEAARIGQLAQVLIVIGIGGSNRAAVAAMKALQRECDSPTSLYFAGDTLSPTRLEDALSLIEEKSVALNVIAKDFNTVEPGVTFRMLRAAMKKKYGASYTQRIVLTGSYSEGQLFEFAQREGYGFLPFPKEIGGRFSALTEVSLFPLAVAGVDVAALLKGAKETERNLRSQEPKTNAAIRYATLRNLIRKKGIVIESLVTFEPDLQDFTRWWIQLFAESEGKTEHVLFPVGFSFSEDLHAVGQYVQEGPKILLETFLDLHYTQKPRTIELSAEDDGFSYLNGKSFAILNKTVYQAALSAHHRGGIPCIELVGEHVLDAESLGSLFYFFLFAAYCSAVLMGVNPFNQNGVEGYKKAMYKDLGKPGF